jgi:hypothetical protein
MVAAYDNITSMEMAVMLSKVLAASIIKALMMEAASTSETSVNFYQNTRRNNLEDTP